MSEQTHLTGDDLAVLSYLSSRIAGKNYQAAAPAGPNGRARKPYCVEVRVPSIEGVLDAEPDVVAELFTDDRFYAEILAFVTTNLPAIVAELRAARRPA